MALYLYLILYLIVDFILLLISRLIDERNEKDKINICNEGIGCTVIIPLIDDISGLSRTLKSIIRQEYKAIEVIVAINGLKALFIKSRIENDLKICCLDLDIRLIALRRKNKANAINKALRKAKYDWYCIIDSDCTLTNRKSLSRIMRHTVSDVVAVGGRVCVTNPYSFVGLLQKMEYNRTFMCLRNAMYRADAVTIISGAYGVFNKGIVLKAGGYTTKHVGEDMDITLRLQRYCREKHISYRVEYEMKSSINTKVPLSLAKLFRQRDRWQRGLIGSFLGNITFRRDKNFTMRYIAQPYMLIFQVMAPIVFGFGVVRFVYQFVFGEISSEAFIDSIVFFIVYALIESLIDVIVEVRRCRMECKKFNKAYVLYAVVMQIPMLFFQSFLMIAKLFGALTYPFRKRVW